MEKIVLILLLCMMAGSCKYTIKKRMALNEVNSSGTLIAPDTLHIQNPYSSADSISNYAVALAKEYLGDTDSLEKSLVYLNKALKINTSNMWMYYNKMSILSMLKKREEAIDEAYIVLSYNSDNTAVNINAYLNIGNAYQKLGKVDSANVAYDKAKKLIINEMKTDDDLNYQIALFRILSIQKGKNATQYYFNKVLDSSQRTDYVKRFIDTFNVKDYLNHF